ncbi:MAG TPA: PAS domain-containing protein [Syntrophales bacterium]|nr:PAS domain-containing protein [Syntrophales bacterium]
MKFILGPFNSILARYGISICITVAALLAYQVLVNLVGGNLPTYITFYPAVILSALLTGFTAGLLATATAALLAAYWILPPEGFVGSSLPDALGLAIFSFNGVLICMVAELYRRARQKAADYAAEMAVRDERKKAEEALRMSEAQLRLAQDAAKAGSWEWDLGTNENVWSEELWKLYGLEPHCCKPTYETWRHTIHPDDREKVEQVVQEAATKGVELNAEWRVLDRDGSLRWLMSRGRPLHDTEERPIRYIGIVMDITERKKIEEILRKHLLELEAANKELDSFSYSVSHDLRAPLRAIDGYTRLIINKYGDQFNEDVLTKFNVIRNSVHMMAQLIDDLLAFSQLGRKDMSMSKIDMETLVRDVWEALQAINPSRNINLTVNGMPPSYGDKSLIKQVYVNLLSNAIKFTKNQNPALIEVGGHIDGDKDVYYVKDNGVGFDMKYYDKLFGVFQRLHSPEDFEGTGIGLAIVQRIIYRHEGLVWAEGKVDEGATFYFSLPSSHSHTR